MKTHFVPLWFVAGLFVLHTHGQLPVSFQDSATSPPVGKGPILVTLPPDQTTFQGPAQLNLSVTFTAGFRITGDAGTHTVSYNNVRLYVAQNPTDWNNWDPWANQAEFEQVLWDETDLWYPVDFGPLSQSFTTTQSPEDLDYSWPTSATLNFSQPGTYALFWHSSGPAVIPEQDKQASVAPLDWTISGTVIPEPAHYALLTGLGLLGLAWYRRRRA